MTALIVLDLETTGLDPLKHSVIEIGALAVDPSTLEVLPGGEFSMYVRPWSWDHIVPVVQEMHDHNGLFAFLRENGGSERWFADSELARFFEKHAGDQKVILAGNSIAFDHGWIKAQLPRSAERLSHRTYDISATRRLLTELAGVEFPQHGEMPHRALHDCRIELTELRALVSYFKRADEALSAVALW